MACWTWRLWFRASLTFVLGELSVPCGFSLGPGAPRAVASCSKAPFELRGVGAMGFFLVQGFG